MLPYYNDNNFLCFRSQMMKSKSLANIAITEEDINLINVVFERFNDEHIKAGQCACNNFYPCMQGWEALKTFATPLRGWLPPQREKPFNETFIPPMSVVPFAVCGCHHPTTENFMDHFHSDVFDTLAEALIICEKSIFPDWPVLGSLANFMSLENYMNWMSSPLRESLKVMHFPWRLSWCINLLINYHCKTECSAFISCAIKLCLKLIVESKRSGFRQKDFMYATVTNNCDENVVIKCLEVFFMLSDDKADFYKGLLYPGYLLKCAQKACSYFFHDLVNLKDEYGVRCMEESLVERPTWFVYFLEFGFISFYSAEIECAMIKTNIAFHDSAWNEFFKILEPQAYSGRNKHFQGNYLQFRCLQVIDLFIRVRRDRYFRKMADFIVKLLWAAIPDPYLTETDFKTCFSMTNPTILKDLEQVWSWYNDHVLKGTFQEKSPRSLKHLSRCAIRKHLSLCLQLPRGIKSLELPVLLEKYLVLNECGVNPCAERDE